MKFELRKEEKEGNKTQACARAPGSSLTRNISLPKSLAGWPMRTPTNPSLMAASTGDSSGIWPFFIRHIQRGGRHRRLFSRTVRSSAWLLRSRSAPEPSITVRAQDLV